MCLFCTQFFDEDFSNYVNYHLGTTEIADRTLQLEDQSGKLNELDPSITRRLHNYSVTKTLNADFLRPTSAFIQEMEIDALRDKKYLPKLMSNMGCTLARTSRSDYVDVTKVQLFSPQTKHGRERPSKILNSNSRIEASDNSDNPNKKSTEKISPTKKRGNSFKVKPLYKAGRKLSRREFLADQMNANIKKEHSHLSGLVDENGGDIVNPALSNDEFVEEQRRRIKHDLMAEEQRMKMNTGGGSGMDIASEEYQDMMMAKRGLTMSMGRGGREGIGGRGVGGKKKTKNLTKLKPLSKSLGGKEGGGERAALKMSKRMNDEELEDMLRGEKRKARKRLNERTSAYDSSMNHAKGVYL